MPIHVLGIVTRLTQSANIEYAYNKLGTPAHDAGIEVILFHMNAPCVTVTRSSPVHSVGIAVNGH